MKSFEGPENLPPTPQGQIDISGGWDTESQTEIFLEEVKKMPFYRPGLLYSGFDADRIGESSGSSESTEEYPVIFCGTEDEMIQNEERNPVYYALTHKNPTIAVYDPSGLERVNPDIDTEGFKVKDKRSLVGLVRLKTK